MFKTKTSFSWLRVTDPIKIEFLTALARVARVSDIGALEGKHFYTPYVFFNGIRLAGMLYPYNKAGKNNNERARELLKDLGIPILPLVVEVERAPALTYTDWDEVAQIINKYDKTQTLDANNVRTYLANQKSLSTDMSVDLGYAMKRNNHAAMEALFFGHRGFVRLLAVRYSRKHNLPAEDFEQEGSMRLWETVKKYNPALGYSLYTYLTAPKILLRKKNKKISILEARLLKYALKQKSIKKYSPETRLTQFDDGAVYTVPARDLSPMNEAIIHEFFESSPRSAIRSKPKGLSRVARIQKRRLAMAAVSSAL
jgi:hypothetical protein